jgi:hypothetical protein
MASTRVQGNDSNVGDSDGKYQETRTGSIQQGQNRDLVWREERANAADRENKNKLKTMPLYYS